MSWTPEQIATFHARYEARKAEEKAAKRIARTVYERERRRVDPARTRLSNLKWATNNREVANKHNSQYEKTDKGRLSAKKKRVKKYGLTLGELAALFTSQGNCCAICNATDPGNIKQHWHTDHDHITGKVRGILCHQCNVGIGHLKDDPSLLRTAADYLDRFTQK